MSAARQALLDRCVIQLREVGFSDLSLREIAARVGTSHRMLIYHFGSREQLLADIVEHIEASQRSALADLFPAGSDTADNDLMEVGRRFWQRLSDPDLASAERLFFEIHSHALYERPWTAAFRTNAITPWAESLATLLHRHGHPPDEARQRARLAIAATRGLLLDLLLTGDRELLDAAHELLTRLLTERRPES